MTSMMVLRQVYTLVVDLTMRESLDKDRLPGIGDDGEHGRWVTARKGVTSFPEGLCNREGKSSDIFVLIMRISRWNQIHTGSLPWNNESVTVHWEDEWSKIIVLDIGCDFNCDNGLWTSWEGGESWYYFWGCRCDRFNSLVHWYMHHILLFVGLENVHMCICGYCKYCNELC